MSKLRFVERDYAPNELTFRISGEQIRIFKSRLNRRNHSWLAWPMRCSSQWTTSLHLPFYEQRQHFFSIPPTNSCTFSRYRNIHCFTPTVMFAFPQWGFVSRISTELMTVRADVQYIDSQFSTVSRDADFLMMMHVIRNNWNFQRTHIRLNSGGEHHYDRVQLERLQMLMVMTMIMARARAGNESRLSIQWDLSMFALITDCLLSSLIIHLYSFQLGTV